MSYFSAFSLDARNLASFGSGLGKLRLAFYLILGGKLDICRRDDLALGFKDPVLFLRNENMVAPV